MSSKPGLGTGGATVFAGRAAARRANTEHDEPIGGAETPVAPRVRRGFVGALAADDAARDYVIEVPLDDRLADNPDNPRQQMGDLSGLAASLENHGLIQPIIVWPAPAFRAKHPDLDVPESAQWVIIAGHRRRAAGLVAGKSHLPAIVSSDHAGPRASITRALVENVHREDLAPIEEARALATLRDMGMSQRDIASETGISQSQVSKRLQLLEMPTPVQDAISEGTVAVNDSLTQLKGLSPQAQEAAVEAVRRDGITLEAAARQQQATPAPAPQLSDAPPTRARAESADRAAVHPAPERGDASADTRERATAGEGLEDSASAATARAEACQLATRSELKTAEVLELLTDLALDPPRARPGKSIIRAARWLGIELGPDAETTVAQLLRTGGKSARALAVGTALARREADLASGKGDQPWDAAARRHVDRLIRWGVHQPSEYEQSKLQQPDA
jgi:ParB family chromosome partitioning protein